MSCQGKVYKAQVVYDPDNVFTLTRFPVHLLKTFFVEHFKLFGENIPITATSYPLSLEYFAKKPT